MTGLSPNVFDGSGLGALHWALELGENLFDRVQVRTVGRRGDEIRTSCPNDGARRLAEDLGRGGAGFDVVVNCDCVYEPLYGKR